MESEEEITPSYCPYKKTKNFFSSFFGNKTPEPPKDYLDKKDDTSSKNSDIETGGKCPFGFDKKTPKTTASTTDKPPQGKCPFGYDNPSSDKKINTKEEDLDDDVDSDEEQPKGGCPVMNRGKKDPQNKHFEPFFEIPCYGPYDFLFLIRGSLDTEEWLKKTEKLRKYPRYLRNTLFYQAQEKLAKVHEREFPMVFFIYDDIKQKACRLFRRKKYKEAIEHMTYSYGLLKWIQFKDKERQKNFVVKPSLDAILDEDLEEKEVYLDDVKVEEDSYKACKVFLLEIMAYAHMELRQYSCALECLDECAEVAEDKVADVYFRRSQCRTYNKNSTDADLELARNDIEKAIKIKDTENIYKEHKEILEKIIKERNDKRVDNVKRLITKAKAKMMKAKELKLKTEEVFFVSNEDAVKQYKILKEMKSKYYMAVKFFTETKNEEQLGLTYKEFESFHQSYQQFKFFYKFKVNELDPKIRNQLSEEEQKLLDDTDFTTYLDEYKYKVCEHVFSEGNYNIQLFQYALEKVFEEDRKEQEEREKEEEALRPKVSWSEKIANVFKGNVGMYISIVFMVCTIAAILGHYFMYSGNIPGKI